MPPRGEIWYCEKSSAAVLVDPLRGRYPLRLLPRSPMGRIVFPAPEDRKSPAVCLADLSPRDLKELRRFAGPRSSVRIIGVSRNGANGNAAGCVATLSGKAKPTAVRAAVQKAFKSIEVVERERSARAELKRVEREMKELHRIGVALSETRDINSLLEMILRKAREISCADAGSLYLIEETRPEPLQAGRGERRLRFTLTQNESMPFPYKQFDMPLREDSLAGYAALHGKIINLPDAYRISKRRPYRFNPSYDQETGYRTRSLLTLPMKNGRGEVLGVLQLINCKSRPGLRLTSPEHIAREVRPFPKRAVRMANSLASQAAVAYENSRLYRDIETLFEGFVRAAVTAIEQRDPTTSGHSQRVSKMTVGLAEVVDRAAAGPYKKTHFTPEQMKEIRYAALLHDFGKLGVREEVLVKAKKLYPGQREVVSHRFDYLYKDLEAWLAQEKLRGWKEFGPENAPGRDAALDAEYQRRRAALEDAFRVIVEADEPTVLPESQFVRLFEIAGQTYRDPRGLERPLLTPEEIRFLTIPQGSLDPEERAQIEAHVVHSFNFLLQIPWTHEIREIPRIARAHHEKLNGTGYPYGLEGDEIPVQAKIMTICDIFDALSAADRPYKKAVPPEHALGILEMSVRDHELDPALFQLFLEAKIYGRGE